MYGKSYEVANTRCKNITISLFLTYVEKDTPTMLLREDSCIMS